MIRVVCFDFWNTLMWEPPGALRKHRIDSWCAQLAGLAPAIDDVKLGAAHDHAHRSYLSSWEAGRQFVVEDAVDLMIAALGEPARAGEVRQALVDGFDAGGRFAPIEPTPGVRRCLDELISEGCRLAVICDIGLTPSPIVRELLSRHDLLRSFSALTFSDEIGAYKPSLEVFAHCLASCRELDAARAAHVGDRTRTDVAGAKDAGLTAVRYTGIFDDPVREPEADLVVDALERLPGALRELAG